ncbi:hypothetical protein OVA26_16695 [Microbacterium sp. SL62]|uniref:hypothetical protein n=1 Tax=Microbacterium sp. SL62 TaxID=2995139 RepID=UPI0022733D04|nr:hypothetical protein [Microbacterium sp. SL62]MCY1718577.1 hypothetical protein [Microbacterium sp. SL62]
MKTPEWIADTRLVAQPSGTSTLYLGNETVFNIQRHHADDIRKAMIVAVRDDRQSASDFDPNAAPARTFESPLAEALHGCLMDRETPGATRAATWVAENEADRLWDHFVGPLLDALEQVAR